MASIFKLDNHSIPSQRFFASSLPWAVLFWVFFKEHVFRSKETYILAGDEVVGA
jgi:hypothetical protein